MVFVYSFAALIGFILSIYIRATSVKAIKNNQNIEDYVSNMKQSRRFLYLSIILLIFAIMQI